MITPITPYSGSIPDPSQTMDNYSDNLTATHQYYDGTFVTAYNNRVPLLNNAVTTLKGLLKFAGYKGDYDYLISYSKGEVVTYLDNEYISLEDNNLDNLPSSEFWEKLVVVLENTPASEVTEDTHGNLQDAIVYLKSNFGGKKQFIADGTITAGKVVALTSAGKVTAITALNIDNWVGIAINSATDSQSLTVTLPTGINENQTGLTINSTYYTTTDGSLTLTDTGRLIGRAIAASKIQIKGDL